MRIAVVLATMCVGCATIMSGGPDRIPIATNPTGASVFVDGVLVARTPTVLTVDPRSSLGYIRIEAQGFLPINIRRYKSINGWFWADICWGVFPMIVDLVTGEYESFDDTPIALGMTPTGSYQPGPEQPQPPPGYPGAPPAPQPQPPSK
jgi:hypothetical protein